MQSGLSQSIKDVTSCCSASLRRSQYLPLPCPTTMLMRKTIIKSMAERAVVLAASHLPQLFVRRGEFRRAGVG